MIEVVVGAARSQAGPHTHRGGDVQQVGRVAELVQRRVQRQRVGIHPPLELAQLPLDVRLGGR